MHSSGLQQTLPILRSFFSSQTSAAAIKSTLPLLFWTSSQRQLFSSTFCTSTWPRSNALLLKFSALRFVQPAFELSVTQMFTTSRWSGRNYCPHEIYKHDTKLDSMRPVRCEVSVCTPPSTERRKGEKAQTKGKLLCASFLVYTYFLAIYTVCLHFVPDDAIFLCFQLTGHVMTAKEYVYRYRFIAGTGAYYEEPIPVAPMETIPQAIMPPPIYTTAPPMYTSAPPVYTTAPPVAI